jgi:hypothetical protein
VYKEKNFEVGDRVKLLYGCYPNNCDYITPEDINVVTKTYTIAGQSMIDLKCECCTIPDVYLNEIAAEFQLVKEQQ